MFNGFVLNTDPINMVLRAVQFLNVILNHFYINEKLNCNLGMLILNKLFYSDVTITKMFNPEPGKNNPIMVSHKLEYSVSP